MSTAHKHPAYRALALQTKVQSVNQCKSRRSARTLIGKTIARIGSEIRASKKFIGPDLRLVVLPEYVLTAYPTHETIPEWADKACLAMDGPEYKSLGQIAHDHDIYLAGNAYELDPHFDGLYFQTCFILGPKGDVILRYRRLNSMFAPTPHDVWDKYVQIYGLEGVFPVVDTDIGRLAALASEEVLYPEISRALVMRGAEVLVHPTGEMGMMSDTPKSICRKARAVENMAYMISANAGGIDGQNLPDAATDGCSSIVDYNGVTLARSGWGSTMTACADIDIGALRRNRRRPGMGNLLSRQRFELFTHTYAQNGSQNANTMLDKDGAVRVPERAHFIKTQQKAIARLAKKNLI